MSAYFVLVAMPKIPDLKWEVRGAIEVTVLVLGYLLGGPVGVGTLITAFTTGYAVQLAFSLGGYDKDARHMDLYGLLRYLRDSEP